MKYTLMIIFSSWLTSQSLLINEIVSSNSSIFYDEDGDTPDWIEIYNPSDIVVNLEGYGLSDDLSEKLKWQFPNVLIQPKDFLLILASDKDRKKLVSSWDAEITVGDQWNYWSKNSAPPSNWT